jgi:DNA-binding NarL/FixJ family response regulator
MYNVFIVDDEPQVVNALTDLLEGLTNVHVVAHAESEREAVEWLIQNRSGWNLAIVDLALGSGTGLQVLSACRVRQVNQKVVVLSGHLNAAMRRRCASLGADAAFTKDSDIESILNYCRDASTARKS